MEEILQDIKTPKGEIGREGRRKKRREILWNGKKNVIERKKRVHLGSVR